MTQITGKPIRILELPLLDYWNMLLETATEEDIELVATQVSSSFRFISTKVTLNYINYINRGYNIVLVLYSHTLLFRLLLMVEACMKDRNWINLC